MRNSIYASSIILLHYPDTLIIRNAITATSSSSDHRSFTKVRRETDEDRPINLIQAFPIELRQGHEIHGRNIVSMKWNWKEKYGTRRKASFTGRQFQRRFSRLALVSSDTRGDTYFESANASFNIAQVGRGLDRVALFPEKWIYIPGSADTCNRSLSLSLSSLLYSRPSFICLEVEVGGAASRVDKCEARNSSYRLRLACDETAAGSLCFRPCAFQELDGQKKGRNELWETNG